MLFIRGVHIVRMQMMPQRYWCFLIKEDFYSTFSTDNE